MKFYETTSAMSRFHVSFILGKSVSLRRKKEPITEFWPRGMRPGKFHLYKVVLGVKLMSNWGKTTDCGERTQLTSETVD